MSVTIVNEWYFREEGNQDEALHRSTLSGERGGTVVRFTHAGWKSTDGEFRLCNATWGELMYRLKAYAEGKEPGAHFSAAGWAYG